MALQKQLVPIILGQGVDTKTDPKAVQAPKLLALENAVFQKHKRISKRYGLTAQSSDILGGGSVSAADFLTSFNSELLLRSNEKLYTRTDSKNAWADKGDFVTANVETTQIARTQRALGNQDMTQSGNIALYAWRDASAVLYATVRDVSTGAILIAPTQLFAGTATDIACSYTPDYLFVYWRDAAGTNLYCKSVSLANPTTFSAQITVAADANVGGAFVRTAKYGDAFFLLYRTSTPSIRIGIVSQLNPAASLGGYSGLAQNYPAPITYAADPSNGLAAEVYYQSDITNDALYVAYGTSTPSLELLIYPLTLATPLGPFTIEAVNPAAGFITMVSEGPGSVRVFYGGSNTAPSFTRMRMLTRTGPTGSASTWIRQALPTSKPWRYNGKTYVIVGYVPSVSGSVQRGYWVLDVNKNTIARISYQNGGAPNLAMYSAVQRSDSSWAFLLQKTSTLEGNGTTLKANAGLQEVVVNFDLSDSLNRAEINQGAFFGGGALLHYDGNSVTELGFNVYPEITAAVISGAGGVSQDCYYVACYEWTDNQGNFHRSAPSIPVFFASTGADQVTVSVSTLKLTVKTGVSIVLYRTDGVAGNYYRVSDLSAPTANDPTVDAVGIVDSLAESTLRLRALLYTTGNVLDNIPPDAGSHVGTYNNRLVITGCETGVEAQYSKETVVGEGVAFNDALRLRVDQGSGRLYLSAQLDDKLLLFKRDSIHVTYGQGPTDTGAQNDFITPQLIASDVGCRFPKSVVRMPLGLMFKSDKGFYLIDRGLSVSYIGAEVEEFNGLTVSSAQLLEDVNQVRFTHSDGVCLVYNYFYREWSVFTNYDSVGSVSVSNRYYMARANGQVNLEDSSSWLDNGSPYSMRILLPFIPVAGIQGFQRVYEVMLLGELKSDHVLSARLRYDYRQHFQEWLTIDTTVALGSNYYGQDAYYGASQYNGGMLDGVYQFRIRPEQQKCEAIGIEIKDLNPNAINGEGFSLTALAMVVGLKGGAYRQADSKTMESTS